MKKDEGQWIYGLNPVMEALRAGRTVHAIYIYGGRRRRSDELMALAGSAGVTVKDAPAGFFDSRFPKGHQGIAARVAEGRIYSVEELLEIPGKKGEPALFLLLDGIEDPRNLGAIARSAEAAGVHGMVIQKYRSAGLGPAAEKSSAGAINRVPIAVVPNIKNALELMKDEGIASVGLEAGMGRAPWQADMRGPVALVLGSEDKGVRKTVLERCDMVVSLPMRGTINSLNVSVSAGVVLFEAIRQRTGHQDASS